MAATLPRPRPLPVLLLAWLVPGLGHFFLGRKRRGLAFFLIVSATFGVGIAAEGRLHLPDLSHPLTLFGAFASFGSGLLSLGARALGLGAGRLTASTYEYGTTFLLTAGLMNHLLLLDVWDVASGRKT